MARYDSSSMTMVATVTNTTAESRSLDVVFKGWLGAGGEVQPIANGLLLLGQELFDVAVVGDAPSNGRSALTRARSTPICGPTA